jgi:hypothetical protein
MKDISPGLIETLVSIRIWLWIRGKISFKHFSVLLRTTLNIFCVVTHNTEKFSTLLPTTAIILLHCRQQREKVFKFQFMCVCPRCCLQRRLFFRVVDHSTENLSALLPTTWKKVSVVGINAEKVRIWLSPRIRNYTRIYTRVSIRGLGWCVLWRQDEVKNIVGLSL